MKVYFNLLLLKAKHVIVWIMELFLSIFDSVTVNIHRHWGIGSEMIMEDVLCFNLQLVKEKASSPHLVPFSRGT